MNQPYVRKETMLKNWVARLRRRIEDHCYYLDGQGRLFHLSGEPVAGATKRVYLLVLSRRNYYEHSADLPITDPIELRRAIRLAPNSGPFDGKRFYEAHPLEGGGHRVNFWTLRKQAASSLREGSLGVTIPESVVLCRGQQEELSGYQDSSGLLIIQKRKDGNRSFLIPKGGEHLLETTAQSLGEDAEKVGSLEPRQVLESVRLAIPKLRPLQLLTFSAYVPRKRKPFPWRLSAAMVCSIAISYFAITSAFLWGRGAYLERSLKSIAPEIEQALALEQEFRSIESELRAIQAEADTAIPTWAGLPVIADLIASGMDVKNLRFEQGRFTIYGTAASATGLLEKIVNNPWATESNFAQPVRQRSEGEQFAIEFVPTVRGQEQ